MEIGNVDRERNFHGKFSPVFWILVALADVNPVATLGIFLVLVQKLQATGR